MFRNVKCGGDVALYIKVSLQSSLMNQFTTAIPLLLE